MAVNLGLFNLLADRDSFLVLPFRAFVTRLHSHSFAGIYQLPSQVILLARLDCPAIFTCTQKHKSINEFLRL